MAYFNAQGTTIARGDGASPEVYTIIPQLTSINPIGQSRGLIDVTNLSSPAREYMKALEDGDEISVTAQYDPGDTVHAALRGDMAAELPRNFRITLTDSPPTTVTFSAHVTQWQIGDVAVDSVYSLNMTLKPTGALVFA